MEQELTNEGQELWDNINNDAYIDSLGSKVTKREPKFRKTGLKVATLVAKINNEIKRCEDGIAEQTLKVEHWTSKEQYFKANEAKTMCTMYSTFKKSLEDLLVVEKLPKDLGFEIIEELESETPLSKQFVE